MVTMFSRTFISAVFSICLLFASFPVTDLQAEGSSRCGYKIAAGLSGLTTAGAGMCWRKKLKEVQALEKEIEAAEQVLEDNDDGKQTERVKKLAQLKRSCMKAKRVTLTAGAEKLPMKQALGGGQPPQDFGG